MGVRVRSRIRGNASVVAFAACVLLLAGCEKDDQQIKVYRLAKAPLQNAAALQTPAPSMPPNHPPVGGGTSPVASPAVATGPSSNVPVPPHWEPQPLAQMRQASFLVRGENETTADISLVTLGASSGDVLANVNRWRGQLGQPPITADDLPRVVQHLPSELGHVAVVDIEGKPEQGDPNKDGRIIAAIAPAESGTAFFKLRGNAALAGAEKENFLKWVGGFRK